MYILDVMETCSNPSLSSYMALVKGILALVQIIVPVLLLIAGTVQFVQLTVNPELKDSFRKILNKIIAAIIVFIIPVLINAIMGVVGESTEFSDCWNKAQTPFAIGGENTYISE